MTVQELINKLNLIEDKSMKVELFDDPVCDVSGEYMYMNRAYLDEVDVDNFSNTVTLRSY